MTAIRNLLALPVIATALMLWWIADRFAAVSKAVGNGPRG
jgi:hypothetical protein